MGQQWYVRTARGVAGPLAAGKLRELADAGKIARDTQVRMEGGDWVAASRIKGLTFGEPAKASGSRSADSPASPDGADDKLYAGVSASTMTQLADTARGIEQEPDLPDLSRDAAIPYRILAAFIVGAMVAGGAATLVRLARMLGWLDLGTIGSSLAFRVGVPAIVFVVSFVFIYWAAGRRGTVPEISADMSDEEIAQAIRGR